MNLPDRRNYPSVEAWADALVRELATLNLAQQNQQTPVAPVEALPGSGQIWFGDVIPSGWLEAKGQVLPIDTYPNLARAFGTKWNTGGEGAGNFRMPDARGRVLRGAVASETYGGSDDVTLALANLPAASLSVTDPGHSHSFAGSPHTHSVTDPGHTHGTTGSPLFGGSSSSIGAGGVSMPQGAPGTLFVNAGATGVTLANATAGGTIGTQTSGISVALGGSGTPTPTLPKYLAARWIIKT